MAKAIHPKLPSKPAGKKPKPNNRQRSAAPLVNNRSGGKPLAWLAASTGSISNWLRSRPTALKLWRTADRKKNKYRSFRLQKRIRPTPRTVPSTSRLFGQSLVFLWHNRYLFASLLVIYGLVYGLMVRPVLMPDLTSINETLSLIFGEHAQQNIRANVASLGAVLGSAGSFRDNQVGATAIILLASLVYIWAIRQRHNDKQIKARDALYQGPSSLIALLVVMIVISLQTIPLAIMSYLYVTARTANIFVTGIEDLLFFSLTSFIGLLTIYYATAKLIALYIVTLPGTYPIQAIRAANDIVKFRRLTVFIRVISMVIVLTGCYALIILLFIRFYPSGSFLAAELLLPILLPVAHTYMYKLYRALL